MTALDYPVRPTASVANRDSGPVHVLDNDCLPWNHFISALSPGDYVSGTVGAQGAYNTSWYFCLLSWTTTNLAEFAWDVYTAAGTWRMEWYGDKRSDYGIKQYLVDGVQKGSNFDKYAATRVRTVDVVDSIVLTRGWHRFTSKINGKNASSSGYLNTVSGLVLRRSS